MDRGRIIHNPFGMPECAWVSVKCMYSPLVCAIHLLAIDIEQTPAITGQHIPVTFNSNGSCCRARIRQTYAVSYSKRNCVDTRGIKLDQPGISIRRIINCRISKIPQVRQRYIIFRIHTSPCKMYRLPKHDCDILGRNIYRPIGRLIQDPVKRNTQYVQLCHSGPGIPIDLTQGYQPDILTRKLRKHSFLLGSCIRKYPRSNRAAPVNSI